VSPCVSNICPHEYWSSLQPQLPPRKTLWARLFRSGQRNLSGNPTYQELVETRTDGADAGRPIRQVRAGTASPHRRALDKHRTSCRNRAPNARFRRQTCTAQQVPFSSQCSSDPSTRNVFKKEACSTSLSRGLVTFLPPLLLQWLPLLFPSPP